MMIPYPCQLVQGVISDFFKSYLWGFDLTVKYLKNKINLKKQSEMYKERGNASFGDMRLFLILVVRPYLVRTVREKK
ncbi:hypothetical protein H5410_044901 [Solanum commersonii]|uniref:Uncharacterized protein n=1 Tax=Solanum commersonii TaxID=4109 RepID=A0A9J5X881_SOLCO|nr:hypothetical protein H5410_044901 [Solanum commersonii]